ncbi:MAG: hypothetical protein LBQ87_03845 [Candidatus Fibromonas sp.]|jgi:hypothetical protein|nr:hypothetical protein [Candidatus Fibromonas sp.]
MLKRKPPAGAMGKFMQVIVLLLVMLLPGCDEKQEQKQECDAICEAKKADFELLTDYVRFRNISSHFGDDIYFSVHKTATGAIAGYMPFYEKKRLEAKLSPEEWINFIKALYKCLDKDLNKWGGKDENCYGTFKCTRVLFIDYPDSNQTVGYNSWKAKPTDWDKVEKTINDMLSLIRKKVEVPIDAKLKAEYRKKFGEPITDIEFSTSRIKFWLSYSFTITVTRTETGAILEYSSKSMENIPNIELDIGEWLDFVRALYKIDINKWRKEYGELNATKGGWQWRLEIYYSDKAGFNIFKGHEAYPPNWYEFMKVMCSMKEKIIKKPLPQHLSCP